MTKSLHGSHYQSLHYQSLHYQSRNFAWENGQFAQKTKFSFGQKENKIFGHNLKRHLPISKTAKFSGEMS